MSRLLTTGVISQYWPDYAPEGPFKLKVLIFDETQIPEEPPVWRVPHFTDFSSLQTAASNHSGSPLSNNGQYLKHCWQHRDSWTGENCVPLHCARGSYEHPRYRGAHSGHTIYCGTNSMKFNYFPTGYRWDTNGNVAQVGDSSYHHTVDVIVQPDDSERIFAAGVTNHLSNSHGYYDNFGKGSGFAIRLVRNLTSAESSLPDLTLLDPYVGNNGVVYEVRKYHARAWITNNLCETHYENGDPILFTLDPEVWPIYNSSETPASTHVPPTWQYNYNPHYIGTIPDITIYYGIYYNWWAAVDQRSIVKTDQGWEPPPPPGYEGRFIIPINPAIEANYNYNVDWGDGQISNNVTGEIEHLYELAGIYDIEITGDFPAPYFGQSNWNRLQLLEIMGWGGQKWKSLKNAFTNCYQLDMTATEAPDLSEMDQEEPEFALKETFRNCLLLQGNASFNDWNVEKIQGFDGTFRNTPLEIALGNWNFPQGNAFNHFLDGTNLDREAYDSTLIGWEANAQAASGPHGITMGVQGLIYGPSGDIARESLINNFGWNFSGDDYEPDLVPPTDVSVTTSDLNKTAIVQWSHLKSIEGYNLYFKSNGTFDKQNIDPLTGTGTIQYTLSELSPGEYQVRVTSILDGLESDPSDPVTFTINQLQIMEEGVETRAGYNQTSYTVNKL